jgi:hypothetical protein
MSSYIYSQVCFQINVQDMWRNHEGRLVNYLALPIHVTSLLCFRERWSHEQLKNSRSKLEELVTWRCRYTSRECCVFVNWWSCEQLNNSRSKLEDLVTWRCGYTSRECCVFLNWWSYEQLKNSRSKLEELVTWRCQYISRTCCVFVNWWSCEQLKNSWSKRGEIKRRLEFTNLQVRCSQGLGSPFTLILNVALRS